jgi:hypothetical protein
MANQQNSGFFPRKSGNGPSGGKARGMLDTDNAFSDKGLENARKMKKAIKE